MPTRPSEFLRLVPFTIAVVLALGSGWLAVAVSGWWLLVAVPAVLLVALGIHDLLQPHHNILRNYPIIGHGRYLAEDLRPELQQYFVEEDTSGRPYDRDTRAVVYERAKLENEEKPFGTERDLYAAGTEHLLHSIVARSASDEQPRVRVGGPGCDHPYDMALLNVSAMSFGSLSSNAILALNKGAAAGGFAHDTGEGGLSQYHLRYGADLVWEIGTGYFGCRTDDGGFDPEQFRETAARDEVRCVSLKLSQGAKPGLGGVMPASKVSAEIARVRGVPVGQKVVSPPSHRIFDTPRELVDVIARLRELAGGKPTGFKLCVGYRHEFLAVCKAMLEADCTPDFIIVDGAEGGTGAAPMETQDHVGLPLTDGLTFVHNALVGTGLRDRIRVGASGKVATGSDIVKRLAQGADYTNAARTMMFAVGCIQAQRCHTNTCPTGVATQDPRRARAIDVDDKGARVANYQRETVHAAMQLLTSMGVDDPADLEPWMVLQRDHHGHMTSLAELFEWLEPGELLDGGGRWAADWARATPDRFTPVRVA